MRPTLGVAMIVKDDVERVNTLYVALKDYVDAFYITVSNVEAANKLKKLINGNKDRVVYRRWNNDFAAARNANHKLIKTDYYLWLDDDDIIKGREHLRDMVADMKSTGTDIMYFPYHYKINDLGETTTIQKRERLLRTDIQGEWRGRIHETFVPEEQVKIHHTDGAQVYHIKSAKQEEASARRNHKILVELCEVENPDPRDLHYLGLSYYGFKEWDKAVEAFLKHIQKSGWPEESYRSWIYISNALCEQHKFNDSADAALQATKILPHFPNAYYSLQQAFFHQDKHRESLEFFSTAESKVLPETNQPEDPTVYKYRGKLMAAISFMTLGYPTEAYKLMKKVEKVQAKDKLFKDLMPEVVRAYYEDKAIDKAKWLIDFERDAGGDPLHVIQSLPKTLQGDIRLKELLSEIIPPKQWPNKSIVFYCGTSLEFWGPDTLDKGMGGSEEAIVYLSRALAKLGWQVHVYNDREDEYIDKVDGGEVVYKPWTLFNPNDTFDVLVAWRNPDFHREMKTKARIRGIDMHDTPVGHQFISNENLKYIDKVFLKSEYQYSMADYIPREKVEVISNGICVDQFND